MPKAVLAGLKKSPVDLSVVCAMLDSGGSSGRLRKDYNIVSPGDMRRALIALADIPSETRNLLDFRFEKGELKGHNLANLLITALELSTKNYEKTLDEIKKIFNVKHEVLPATTEKAELCAVLENGRTIKGETNIDIPKHDYNLKIKKVFLSPEARIYAGAKKAIEKADLIVIGPGDLYSSLAQILIIKGVSEAIKKSKAKTVFVCNAMTKKGETNKFSVSDFTGEIEKLLNDSVDYVIFNTKKPSPARVKGFQKKQPKLMKIVSFDKNILEDKKFIGTDLLAESGEIVHDSKKLAKIILDLCRR